MESVEEFGVVFYGPWTMEADAPPDISDCRLNSTTPGTTPND
jgi:hypothetical protein